MIINFYNIPDNAQKFKSEKAGIYGFLFNSPKGKPSVIVFSDNAKAKKAMLYCSYLSEASRAKAVENLISNRIARKNAAVERRAKNSKTELKAGDVLYSSWGYDQTNVDFYKVLEVIGKKKVKLVKLGYEVEREGFMCGQAYPDVLKHNGEPFFAYANKDTIPFKGFNSAHKWDGSYKYTSSYA